MVKGCPENFELTPDCRFTLPTNDPELTNHMEIGRCIYQNLKKNMKPERLLKHFHIENNAKNQVLKSKLEDIREAQGSDYPFFDWDDYPVEESEKTTT